MTTPRSDTISVTEDGRIVVDIAKLWRKPRIVAMVAEIRKKTVRATAHKEKRCPQN